MSSDYGYRLKEQDDWTKKEFQKIFPRSNLIWPSSRFTVKKSPTNPVRVYVETRTPFDGIIMEGIINKLTGRKWVWFYEAAYSITLKRDERIFGLPDIAPDRIVIDLNTERMNVLKKIIARLQISKQKILELTSEKDIETRTKFFQARHPPASFYGGGSWSLVDREKDIQNIPNTLQLFQKYEEFVDPEYLNYDLDKVDQFFSSLSEKSIGICVREKISQYQEKYSK